MTTLNGLKYQRPYFQNIPASKIFKKFQADTRVYASKSSSKELRKAKEAQKVASPQLVG
nr:zinc finger, RING/FYVE/PHD-type [Tanacetum cinerariifolium]